MDLDIVITILLSLRSQNTMDSYISTKAIEIQHPYQVKRYALQNQKLCVLHKCLVIHKFNVLIFNCINVFIIICQQNFSFCWLPASFARICHHVAIYTNKRIEKMRWLTKLIGLAGFSWNLLSLADTPLLNHLNMHAEKDDAVHGPYKTDSLNRDRCSVEIAESFGYSQIIVLDRNKKQKTKIRCNNEKWVHTRMYQMNF